VEDRTFARWPASAPASASIQISALRLPSSAALADVLTVSRQTHFQHVVVNVVRCFHHAFIRGAPALGNASTFGSRSALKRSGLTAIRQIAGLPQCSARRECRDCRRPRVQGAISNRSDATAQRLGKDWRLRVRPAGSAKASRTDSTCSNARRCSTRTRLHQYVSRQHWERLGKFSGNPKSHTVLRI